MWFPLRAARRARRCELPLPWARAFRAVDVREPRPQGPSCERTWQLLSRSLQACGHILDAEFGSLVSFHTIERPVGCPQQLFDGLAIARINGAPHADGAPRLLTVVGQASANSGRYFQRGIFGGLGQQHGELVATVASRGVHRTALTVQNFTQALDGTAAH